MCCPFSPAKTPQKIVLGVVLDTSRHFRDLKVELQSGVFGIDSNAKHTKPHPVWQIIQIVTNLLALFMKQKLAHCPHPAHPTLSTPLTTVNTTVSITIFTHTGKTGNETGGEFVVRFHPTATPQSTHFVVHLVLPLCCGVGHYIQPVDLSVVCVHHGVVIIEPRCISVDVVPTRNGSHVYWRRTSCAVS